MKKTADREKWAQWLEDRNACIPSVAFLRKHGVEKTIKKASCESLWYVLNGLREDGVVIPRRVENGNKETKQKFLEKIARQYQPKEYKKYDPAKFLFWPELSGTCTW